MWFVEVDFAEAMDCVRENYVGRVDCVGVDYCMVVEFVGLGDVIPRFAHLSRELLAMLAPRLVPVEIPKGMEGVEGDGD
jgi:hypothetical protein